MCDGTFPQALPRAGQRLPDACLASRSIVDTVHLGCVLAPPIPADLRAFAATRVLAPLVPDLPTFGAPLRTPPLPANTRPVRPPETKRHGETRFRPWLRTAVLASLAMAAGVAAIVATSTPAVAPPAPPSQSVAIAVVPPAQRVAVAVAPRTEAPAPTIARPVPLPPARPARLTPAPPAAPPALAAEGRAIEAQAARVEKLANSLGISPSLLSRGDARLTSSLEKLPPEVRQMYRELAPHYKQTIVSKLQGSTQVLFVTVNHRDAFISGSAAGQNTFEVLQGKLRETRQEGKIDASTASGLAKALEVFSHMSSSQRAAIVGLLEQDVTRAH